MRLRRTFVFAPVALAACFSQSSGGSGPGVTFDASDETAFDSSMPEAEAPDSSVEASMDAPVEAAPQDASVDVPVEAAVLPIVVVVGGVAGFEAGVPVVFSDATGAVVSSATTSAAGTASTLMPGVTMATVLFGTALSPMPYTAMGLKPGDTVAVVDTASIRALGPIALLNMAPPPSAFDGGIANYALYTGTCHSLGATPPVYLNLNSFSAQPCVGLRAVGASFLAAVPALVEALDSSGVEGFAFAKNTSFTTPDDAGYSEVTLPAVWSTAMTSQTVTFNNSYDAGSFPTATYSEVADGILTPASQQMAGNYVTHMGYADAVQVEVSLQTSPAPGFGAAVLLATAAPPAADGNVAFDLSTLSSEPYITGVTIDSTVVAQPKVSWALASGDLSAMTGVVMHLSYSGTTDGGSQAGVWTIVSPGTSASSLQVPALPAALAGFAPVDATTPPWLYDIYAVDGQTALPSFQSMLPIGSLFPQQQCYVSSPAVPPLPGLGHAAVMVYGPGNGC